MKIEVDKKKYELPEFEIDKWESVQKVFEKVQKKAEGNDNAGLGGNILNKENTDDAVDFYYAILHDAYPELTKNKLKKMPVYQAASPFMIKIILHYNDIPLDSDTEKEKV